MKITFLLAQCTTPYLQDCIAAITKVLKELDIEIETFDLGRLPYFSGKKTKEMDKVVQGIDSSKGVIAVTNVPMMSMHGAMQTFFDSATLYSGGKFEKPVWAVTYSEWLGEVEAADKILKNWSVIGGAEGQKICLNKSVSFEHIHSRLERLTEDFYRLIKQERQIIVSTERQIYQYLKTGQNFTGAAGKSQPAKTMKEEADENKTLDGRTMPEIRSFVDILKQDNKFEDTKKPAAQPNIDLSTKEQTIKEIAHLLKRQVNEENDNESDGEAAQENTFTTIQSATYKKPVKPAALPMSSKRLQQIPHYFVAQYDKSLTLVLKYTITNSNEQGFIIINNGDCEYQEHTEETPIVEFMLSEESLTEILSKKITYQKAFMLGKLKVKGNFAILPKLDQVFTSI